MRITNPPYSSVSNTTRQLSLCFRNQNIFLSPKSTNKYFSSQKEPNLKISLRVFKKNQKMSSENVKQPFPEWSKGSEEKAQVMKTLKSCKTVNQFQTLLKSLETVCKDPNDTDIGIVSANVALRLFDPVNSDTDKPELLLSHSKKASSILTPFENYFLSNAFDEKTHHMFVVILRNLWLCAVASRKLNKDKDCLDYLTRASNIGDVSLSAFDKRSGILSILSVVENDLATCNKRLGMPDEKVVVHFRKGTDIQEMYSDEYDVDFGRSCMNLCVGYIRLRNHKEALPFCLKAAKIFRKNFGEESMDVAEARRYLGVIYGSLGDHEKTLEQLRVSTGILKTVAPDSNELVEEQIRSATFQVVNGKYKEAIATLEAIGLDTIKDKGLRAMAYLHMAQAYCCQGKLVDGRRFAEMCGSIFDKKVDQVEFAGYVARILSELAKLYEEINDLENAMLYLERLLTMTENLPMHLLTSVTAKYNQLVFVTGKEETGLRYLKVATRKLKESYGPNHVQVGIAYSYLGHAYLVLERHLTAADIYKDAKEIMDATLGPYHENSINVCKGLLLAYKGMGSHSEVKRLHEIIDERLKKEPKTLEELEDAVRKASIEHFNL